MLFQQQEFQLVFLPLPIGQWISPEVTGQRPAPCAAFSFIRVDKRLAVLFGGRQRVKRVNELHILDMETWASSTNMFFLVSYF